MEGSFVQELAEKSSQLGARPCEQVCKVDVLEACRVVLFNDNEHSFDEVISQLIKAIKCSHRQAEQHAWQVHTRGRSIVYIGALHNCLQVSAILEEIVLKTEIQTG